MNPAPPRPAPLSAAALLALALGASLSGCATADLRSTLAMPQLPPLAVRIDGLSFLTLTGPRLVVVAQMRAHGYQCLDEAASGRHVPCTALAAAEGPAAVVLSFVGESLDAVRTTLARKDADPRDQFDAIFDAGRRTYPQSFVQRTDDVFACRFMPGDGTAIEVHHLLGGQTIDQIHFAPHHRGPGEAKSVRLSWR